MTITKHLLRILRYIHHKKSVSYSKISKKFEKDSTLSETLDSLIRNGYIIQIGGTTNEYGDPLPICSNTLFKLDDLGIAEVECHQWFNAQFVLLQIALPIVIAIITTLITIFLTMFLSPSL